jgi:hypothetical protein
MKLHGVITQKNTILIFTARKPPKSRLLLHGDVRGTRTQSGTRWLAPKDIIRLIQFHRSWKLNKNFWITYLPLIRHGPHRKLRLQQFFCCVCICCSGNVFTEPLPTDGRGIHVQTHGMMGGIYDVRRWDRWDRLRCHDTHTKFRKNWCGHWTVNEGIHRQHGDLISHIGFTALVDRGRFFFFQFLNPYTVGRTPWAGDQTVARPLPTPEQHSQNKRTQTSMPRVGFEPTMPVFERAKTARPLWSASFNLTNWNLQTQFFVGLSYVELIGVRLISVSSAIVNTYETFAPFIMITVMSIKARVAWAKERIGPELLWFSMSHDLVVYATNGHHVANVWIHLFPLRKPIIV